MAAIGLSHGNSCDGNVHKESFCDPKDSDQCISRRVNISGMHTFNTEVETTLGEAYSYLFASDHVSPSEGNMLCPITDTVEQQVVLQTSCLNEQSRNCSDILQILSNELSCVPKDVFIEHV